ncbi:hypothetical protein [Phenylobacterium sp.]|uniref:hypothetical protein n=1 Tax=Phenylobacterium sp. TaxID=1871053 RepID=UPI002735AE66|nr:hypothetical protein [Phenylobacterium sp.]MDP3854271.1 hypothetical protein [Phenylobacterium sp.]
MHISKLTAGQTGSPAPNSPGGSAATAALNDPSSGLDRQLKAYQVLVGRWREAGHDERAALAPTLTESPFAKRVQSTLNAFTRAAWAGPEAVPPAPQAKMLEAFDALSEDDREIVAAMQLDASGRAANATPEAYRARLQADLEAAPPPARGRDTVTLSQEALDHLAGQADAAPAPERPSVEGRTRMDLAAAVTAYARAGG